jgi:fructose-1,6-bisphosphatase/inositol monophosphatase family enzyme
MRDDARLLDELAEAAREAGEAILEVVRRGFEVEAKHDRSPVTEADRAAELIILAALGRAAPGVPVIAEEEVAAGRIPAHDDIYFLVDPLDGTKEFVRGGDDYTVNIGLIERDRPDLASYLLRRQGGCMAAASGSAPGSTKVVDGGKSGRDRAARSSPLSHPSPPQSGDRRLSSASSEHLQFRCGRLLAQILHRSRRAGRHLSAGIADQRNGTRPRVMRSCWRPEGSWTDPTGPAPLRKAGIFEPRIRRDVRLEATGAGTIEPFAGGGDVRGV